MLHVHRAERADRLAGALAEVLARPAADPFEAEVVCVPAKGVERWLAQRLSHRLGAGGTGDGICANVSFPSVAAVVDSALAVGGGIDPGSDPWQPQRLVWHLLGVVDDCAGESWCAALGAHLGPTPQERLVRGRRYATARHLAALFAAYGAYRPAMVASWHAGADSDGVGGVLPDDLRWQPELWRRLRAVIGVPSPGERLGDICARLAAEPASVELPQRLSVFGTTRLSPTAVAVLGALAAHRDVHLWLPHPSPSLWERLAQEQPSGPVPRLVDRSGVAVRHPLLASWGRDAREMQLALAAVPAAQHHTVSAETPATLLGHLQRAIAADECPSGGIALDPSDRSVQVHACHGAERQVEVVREVILGLLAADPSLEPRDVLVLCPDIETFAPLITASFGLGEEHAEHPGHRLRVRLADRALRQVNPLLGTVSRLLELADSRLTAAHVLDLLASSPVRRGAGVDDDDLERLRDLVAASGVRWGFDAAHRGRFAVRGVGQNTWTAGLERMLLGVAMSEDDQHWLGTALPLDDVDSSDVDLIGRLAEFLDRLAAALDRLTGEQPLSRWLVAIVDAVEALTATADVDAWQATQLRAELADVEASGPSGRERDASAHVEAPLVLADVRALFAERLRGRPTRANFRTGDLTMCTLVPMRSVPHRVVCVLGLDDGVFPRNAVVDGDDVLARNPCAGERDPRSEDRQLLLDAVHAATDHLIVLYSGADERTNARRPPAVPLDELLDAIDATVATADGRPAREHVVVRHPLQPFDARNFTAGALGTGGPFSFDTAGLAGAEAARSTRSPVQPFLSEPLPPCADDDPVALDELRAFLEHPVKAFLTQRLGLTLFTEDDDPAEALPLELNALELWAIGDRLLRARLGGADPARCKEAEWRRGTLPPGPLGRALLAKLDVEIEPLVAAGTALRAGDPATVDVSAALPGGRLVVGTVGGLHGCDLVTVEYSKLAPKHRLRAWVQLLALTVARPEKPWRAVAVGRAQRGGALRSTIGPVDPVVAASALADLVRLREDGLCEPLPLVAKTSHLYAESLRAVGDPVAAALTAAKAWTGEFGEMHDAAHVLAWGADGDPRGDTRFGDLATRVWGPLLDAEEVDRP